MLLSRLRPARKKKGDEKKNSDIPELESFLEKRDYIGALSFIEHEQKTSDPSVENALWLGYCAYHAGDYKKASEAYEWILSQKDPPPEAFVYLGCCFFFMAMYDEARQTAERAPKSPLQNRLLFHVAHKLKDEKKLMFHHSQLKDSIEDQMCLAAMHYLREHYEVAMNQYKKLVQQEKSYHALNVYLALCYYRLDYYDVSIDMVQRYLDIHPHSPIAVNLKACNHFRLYNTKAAENELKAVRNLANSELSFAKDVIKLNTVVFRKGDAALQVFPALVDVIPEALMNLCIYYLKKGDVNSAYDLMKDNSTELGQNPLLKAITFTLKGYEDGNHELLETAASLFKTFGDSPADCDTIAGRQSMASAAFLWKNFEDVLVYLKSIKSFFETDDMFNFNYGQALVQHGDYKDAEDALKLVKDQKYTEELCYLQCLARAYIRNGRPEHAWQVFKRVNGTPQAGGVLKIIGNDCYIIESYYYALRAFDALQESDVTAMPMENLMAAKKGSFVGIVKMFSIGTLTLENLRDSMKIMEKSRDNSHVANILAIVRLWTTELCINL